MLDTDDSISIGADRVGRVALARGRRPARVARAPWLQATRTRAALLVAAYVMIALCAPLGHARPATVPSLATATAFVKDLYRSHFAHRQRWDLTFARYRSRFAEPLLAAFAAEDRWSDAHPDEVPNLDGDPLTDSQETATGYTVCAAVRDGNGVVVPVTVQIDGETRAVRVRLVVERSGWRIADVEYGDGPSLKGLLEAPHV